MSEQSPVDVSILVVSYNTRDLTDAAIASVVAETHGLTYEIIAVDNASADGSVDMLRGHAANVRLIALDTNIGFARANNLAAAHATGRYILLLNPDTLIRENAIAELVAFARANPDAKIWGGRTLYGDGSLNPSSCWQRMTPWNLFCRATGLTAIFPKSERCNGEAYGGWDRSDVRGVDIVSGCFFLIERELWNILKGFDPLFFMYGEEADLCLRATRLGARPMVTPAATIVHYGGASERVRTDKLVRLLAAKSSLVSRHWSAQTRLLGRALNAAWPLSRLIATGIVAAFRPTAEHRDSADAWRQVWRRRQEWINGYRAPVSDQMSPEILISSLH